MTIPDLINGGFELISSIMVWWNIATLYRDKEIKGVHIVPTAFFFSWGIWNLFYYPHLNQWLSFFGGCSIVLANGIWVLQMFHYGQNRGRDDLTRSFTHSRPAPTTPAPTSRRKSEERSHGLQAD
jgi:hypothetical protein